MAGWSEQNIDLGGLKLKVGRGGSGRPVLVLHHDIGTLDKLPFYEALSARFDVIVPVQVRKDPAGNSVAEGQFSIKRLDFKVGEGAWSDPSVVADDVVVRVRMVIP